jgi:hypothetical protein
MLPDANLKKKNKSLGLIFFMLSLLKIEKIKEWVSG